MEQILNLLCVEKKLRWSESAPEHVSNEKKVLKIILWMNFVCIFTSWTVIAPEWIRGRRVSLTEKKIYHGFVSIESTSGKRLQIRLIIENIETGKKKKTLTVCWTWVNLFQINISQLKFLSENYCISCFWIISFWLCFGVRFGNENIPNANRNSLKAATVRDRNLFQHPAVCCCAADSGICYELRNSYNCVTCTLIGILIINIIIYRERATDQPKIK